MQKCGYEGFGTSRGYRCRSVYEPGLAKFTPSSTKSETVCAWVSRPERWRQERDANSASADGADWEKRYRPPAPSAASRPATPPRAPSPATSTPELPNRVTIGALDDLAKAEAVMLRWTGKVVRLALTNGASHEGVLQYVRGYSIWFVDGTTHRIEDILGAELVELAP